MTALVPLLLAGTAAPAQAWQAQAPQARGNHGAAFDSLRGRMVVCGGLADYVHLADCWTWDASGSWATAAAGPGLRAGHAVAYDAARDRVVVFGGERGLLTVLNDTWEFDGASWQQIATAAAPSPRFGAVAVFDSLRNRIVLFGGNVSTGRSDELWEYDGTNWTLVPMPVRPPARTGHSFAYDPVRQVCVLFGGWDIPFSWSPVVFHQDTWEYDGATWTQYSVSSPPAREAAAMAWDPLGGGVVLFGGVHTALPFQDTWRFDGTNWTSIPGPGPGLRSRASLVADTVSGRLVLFGGHSNSLALDDVWEFQVGAWTRRSATPGARAGAALCHQANLARTTLFGGQRLIIANQAAFLEAADTWQHDGSAWTRVLTATSPPARSEHAMADDLARQRLVLFGGAPFIFPLADTWEFDGANWGQRFPATVPPARQSHAMAYDAVRQRVVMFGGISASFQRLADTWEYDGMNWQARVTAAVPPARDSHRLVFDTGRARTILFGGGTFAGSVVCFADTWEYDGTNWNLVATPAAPAARQGHGMAYDLHRGRTLVFAGHTAAGAFLQDSWEYDGTTWTQPPAFSAPPPGRSRTALTYDTARGSVLMFGGGLPFGALGDTWRFEPPGTASWAVLGSGCAGSAGVPRLDPGPAVVPTLGSTFPLHLTQLPSSPGGALFVFGTDFVQWSGLPLPMALAVLGLPGCQLWVAPIGTALQWHSGGSTTLPFAIPAVPTLAGFTFGAQALSLDSASPSGFGAMSNAIVLRLY
ncbi:MAG: kelch repeat-containing protein [Planctomycetota bacterium]